MRNYLSFILGLLCFVSNAAAQNKEVAVDPKAKTILDKASSAFDTKDGFLATLDIMVENGRTNKTQKMEGKLQLKQDKFQLAVPGVETYYDGKTEYVFMKKENEVNVSEPDKEDLKETNPLMLIKSYQKGYKMRYEGSGKVNGADVDIVNLYPNDRDKNFSIFTIKIDKKKQVPLQMRLQGKNGVNTTVTIKDYKYTKIDDSHFKFNTAEHTDVEVIDLR